MNWGDLITKSGAALGAGLGIFNSWQAWRQRRVDVKVSFVMASVPRHLYQDSVGQPISKPFRSPAILVVNRSSFAVTIEEVGYEIAGRGNYLLSRLTSPGHHSRDGCRWIPDELPHKLEARTSLRLAWWDKDEEALKGKRIRRAYVKTACGSTARAGGDRAFRKLTARLAQGHVVMEPIEG